MYSRLRKLLACIHGIERSFFKIEPFVGFEPIADLDDVRGTIRTLLRDDAQTVDQAVDSLESIVRLTRQMVRDMEDAMSFQV